jgi:hypothetical protein
MAALAEMLRARARICDITSAAILLVYWNKEKALRDGANLEITGRVHARAKRRLKG